MDDGRGLHPFEELEKWTLENQLVDQLNQRLTEADLSQEERLEIRKKLQESTAKIKHCKDNLDKLHLDRKSDLWF